MLPPAQAASIDKKLFRVSFSDCQKYHNHKFPLFRDIVLRLYFPPLVATRTGHDGKPKKVRILLSTGKETLLPASEDKLLKETIYFSD